MSLNYKIRVNRDTRTLTVRCSEAVSAHLARRQLSRAKARGPLHQKIWKHFLSEHPSWKGLGIPTMEFARSTDTNRYYIKAQY